MIPELEQIITRFQRRKIRLQIDRMLRNQIETRYRNSARAKSQDTEGS
jgi:hypothetical protein